MLDFLRKGDVLMVTQIDRLARSIGDLQDIVRTVRAKGASLKATEQPIDTSTAAGKCFLDILGARMDHGGLRRVRLGEDAYFMSPDGYIMPIKKDQAPPDVRYFKQNK